MRTSIYLIVLILVAGISGSVVSANHNNDGHPDQSHQPVVICHKTGNGFIVIEVDDSATNAHYDHGDEPIGSDGRCPESTPTEEVTVIATSTIPPLPTEQVSTPVATESTTPEPTTVSTPTQDAPVSTPTAPQATEVPVQVSTVVPDETRAPAPTSPPTLNHKVDDTQATPVTPEATGLPITGSGPDNSTSPWVFVRVAVGITLFGFIFRRIERELGG